MENRRTQVESVSLFTTSDYWGNTVSLSQTTWDHILKGHPEMGKRLEAIRETVETPHLISESTIDSSTLIFDGYNRMGLSSRLVRVVIRYENRADAEGGSSNGSVSTAYGPLGANTGNVGKVIYFSGLRRRTE